MKIKHPIAMLALTGVLTSCSLAPKYTTPNVSISERWVGVALKEQNDANFTPHQLGWREFFTDLRLQKLIETALQHNHDLKTAALNVELAQAQYRITKSDRIPTVAASGSGTRARSSGAISESYSVGLGISSFELDFFARVKNIADASLNEYLATQEARDAAQLGIINSVAKTYYQWRVAQTLKTLAAQTLSARKKTYQLTTQRFQAGVASGSSVFTARTAVASAESAYQQQRRTMQQAENALAVLVGQPLDTLNLPKSAELTKQFPTKTLFVGLPSNVLLNRPDIRQAEYSLKSTNANIGAARAALFPSISLTSNIGYASTALSSLIDNAARTWSVTPSINLPIFDMGKRRAQVKVSEINKKIAIEKYQKAVQTAFQEVNDALVARETLTEQYQAEQQGQFATSKTLKSAKLQMIEGLISGLDLLDAERNDFNARQNTLSTLLQLLNTQVDLYTALGGGMLEQSKTNTTPN